MNGLDNILSSFGIGGKHRNVEFALPEKVNLDCTTWGPVAALVAACVLFALAGIATVFGSVIPAGIMVFKAVCALAGFGLCLYALFKLATSCTGSNLPCFGKGRTVTTH